ncbi:MAG: hypothetical protein ACE5GQ_02685, partial [Nitrospinales bacterium]
AGRGNKTIQKAGFQAPVWPRGGRPTWKRLKTEKEKRGFELYLTNFTPYFLLQRFSVIRFLDFLESQ